MLAMHARVRRQDIQREITNPKSPWHGYGYDTVALSAIRNNLKKLNDITYTKEKIAISYQDYSGKTKVDGSTPEAHAAFILFDIAAIISTMSMRTDANFSTGEGLPILEDAIELVHNAKINQLSSLRQYKGAEELRAIATIEKQIKEAKNAHK